MIDISTPCNICYKDIRDGIYHSECYTKLSTQNFKDSIDQTGKQCFTCNEYFVDDDIPCSYDKNDFVKFHYMCLENWHRENGNLRYNENIFEITYRDQVDKYYIANSITIPINPYPIYSRDEDRVDDIIINPDTGRNDIVLEFEDRQRSQLLCKNDEKIFCIAKAMLCVAIPIVLIYFFINWL